ncbi:hypothetical protein [Streptomyces aureus]
MRSSTLEVAMNNLRSLAPFIGPLAQKPHTQPWRRSMDALGRPQRPPVARHVSHVSAPQVRSRAV